MNDLFLGLDLSTQQLKCVLIDRNHKLVESENIIFDELGKSIFICLLFSFYYIYYYLNTDSAQLTDL